MTKRNWWKLILFCFALLTFILPVCAAEQEPRVVRVAYFALGDYYKLDAIGEVHSYDKAYLDKVVKNSNLRFEYVNCHTWAQAMEMVRKHEVDLVGTAQWNAAREEEYEFCLESYGYTVAELAALPESNLVFEDYAAINNAVVGCVEGYVRYDEMVALFKEKGINPVIKLYPDWNAMKKALLTGEIDVVAANSHSMDKQWTILSKYYYAPFFFLSWKGNTALTDVVDEAIARINLQNVEKNSLLHSYFPNLLQEPFTKEELNYIAQGKTHTVYFDATTKPLSWYDKETNTMQGVLPDVCKLIAQYSKLKLEIRPLSELHAGAEVDYVTHTINTMPEEEKGTNNNGQTEPIVQEDYFLYHKIGSGYSPAPQGAYRVAIPPNLADNEAFFAKLRPNDTIIKCASPADCIRRLSAGSVDLAFLNSYAANNVIIGQDLNDIVSIPTSRTTFGIGLQFHCEDKVLLANIINKSFNALEPEDIAAIKLEYALRTAPEVSLSYLLKRNTNLIMPLAGIIILLLLIIIGMIIHANIIHKKQAQIEAMAQARMEFFSRMSHDMRTPMNGILGLATLAQEENDLGALRNSLVRIRKTGQYLLSLINDTLDLQKIEMKKMTIDPQNQNLREIFTALVDMLQVTAHQNEVELHFQAKNTDLDCWEKVDAGKLKQILINLVTNALKFTPAGGRVDLVAELLKSEGAKDYFRFIIADTGVGMSHKYLKEEIFSAYAQERNKLSANYTGSGLGLAITKNLVELMDGTISVESELGQGTTFTVDLAFGRGREEEAELVPKLVYDSSVLQNKRILLCEDQPLNAEITKRILAKVGCQVTWAEDGLKGLHIFEQEPLHTFAAILMDIRMPELDGIQTTIRIRELEREDARTIPIIAMTANVYDEDVKQTKAARMNAHLGKPFDPEVLYDTLATFLQKAK